MSIAFKVHTYASLPSTQDYVKELAEEGLPEGTVVQAIEQRDGRGRHGRKWFSPMGNLYMSVLLRPDCDAKQAGQLSFVAAVALSEAMSDVLEEGHKKTLKWPNDILIDGKKVSGILIEKVDDAYVLGMGVNIMNPPDDAVSLNQVTWEIQVPVHPFRDKVLDKLKYYYEIWQKDGFVPIRDLWMKEAHGLNKNIKISFGDNKKEGVFKEINKEGFLIIEDAKGKIIDINSGEVYF